MIDIARTILGRIAVDERALTRLVHEAAGRVEGVHAVRARRGIQVEVEENRAVTVAVRVVAQAGTVLPELGRNVQQRVAEAVQAALEPSAVSVDVTIEAIAA